nr:hypothetical protein [Stenomitos frigidus]
MKRSYESKAAHLSARQVMFLRSAVRPIAWCIVARDSRVVSASLA